MNKKRMISIMVIYLLGWLYIAGPVPWLSSGNSSLTEGSRTKGISAVEQQPSGIPLHLPGGIPVLMYHSVGEEKGNDAVIAKERFAEQMAYLHQHEYHPISLHDLYTYLSEQKQLPLNPVVITFDDGYRDTYEIVFPILKQYGFKSMLFIPAGEVGMRLSWQELQEMKVGGMEIASHSYTHRELGVLSRTEQAEEIGKSKDVLDRFLQQDTRYFCYPNGSYNQDTLQLLKEKGFKLAVTINPGWVKPGDDPLTLRRIWLGNSVDLRHFEERLTREDYPIL